MIIWEYANLSGKPHFITTLQIYDNLDNISAVSELLIFNDLQNNLEEGFSYRWAKKWNKILYVILFWDKFLSKFLYQVLIGCLLSWWCGKNIIGTEKKIIFKKII